MIEASQNDQDDQSSRRKARRSESSSKEALKIRKNAIQSRAFQGGPGGI